MHFQDGFQKILRTYYLLKTNNKALYSDIPEKPNVKGLSREYFEIKYMYTYTDTHTHTHTQSYSLSTPGCRNREVFKERLETRGEVKDKAIFMV